jgi:Uma2 family endonuclease
MGDAARKQPTYADVLALPDNMVGELIGGDLVVQPRPAPRHARATTKLIGQLEPPFGMARGGPGGWVILVEPELHLRDDVLVPDVAGWREERGVEDSEAVAIELAPDWVCEVLSPSTAARDRVQKLPIYAREHLGHVWLVDRLVRTLEVFRLGGEGWHLVGTWADAATVRAEPFADIALELGALWPKPTSGR